MNNWEDIHLLKVIQVFQCELAFACSYVRLELLQGVAAFHSGQGDASQHLHAAQDKWQRLQVADESLATLASMGFSTSQVGC